MAEAKKVSLEIWTLTLGRAVPVPASRTVPVTRPPGSSAESLPGVVPPRATVNEVPRSTGQPDQQGTLA